MIWGSALSFEFINQPLVRISFMHIFFHFVVTFLSLSYFNNEIYANNSYKHMWLKKREWRRVRGTDKVLTWAWIVEAVRFVSSEFHWSQHQRSRYIRYFPKHFTEFINIFDSGRSRQRSNNGRHLDILAVRRLQWTTRSRARKCL